jgi:hypothetical protein
MTNFRVRAFSVDLDSYEHVIDTLIYFELTT